MPQERCRRPVHRFIDGLLYVSLQSVPTSRQSQPRGRRILNHVRALSRNEQLGERTFRSRRDRVSVNRRSHHRPLHPVSRQRQFQSDQRQHGLLFMPPEGFSEDKQSQSRGRRLLAALRRMPQHYSLATRDLRSQQVRLPLDRCARDYALCPMSRQQ